MFSKVFKVGFGAMALGAALVAGPAQAALVLGSSTTGTSFSNGNLGLPATGYTAGATQATFTIQGDANVAWDFSMIELFQGRGTAAQPGDSSTHQFTITGGSYNLTFDAKLISSGAPTNRMFLTWTTSDPLLSPTSLTLSVATDTVFTIKETTTDSAFWAYETVLGTSNDGLFRLTGGSRIINSNTGGGNNGGGSVPEPATLALIGLGLLGAARMRRRSMV